MPCKRASLPIGGPFAVPGGGSFAGTFERKEHYIWLPLLDPEVVKILSPSEALASPRHIYIWVPSFCTQRIL